MDDILNLIKSFIVTPIFIVMGLVEGSYIGLEPYYIYKLKEVLYH